jgi:DNA-binding transcriptional LysR family regulator
MTQPAVTFQVRQLEEAFNTRLFDRTHNRISLTDAGEKVFAYSQEILELYAKMDKSIKDLTGEIIGTILLGASTTVAEYMLPPLLGRFNSQFPSLSIRLIEANSDTIVHKIKNNEIDLGIIESNVNNKKLQVDVCQNDEVVLIVAPDHELANKDEVAIKDILKYKYILREKGSGTREVLYAALAKNKFNVNDINVAMEMSSPESIKGAVESGVGVSIMSRTCVAKELQLGTLKALRLKPRVERNFSFVYQKQKFRLRGIDELLKFFVQSCSDNG